MGKRGYPFVLSALDIKDFPFFQSAWNNGSSNFVALEDQQPADPPGMSTGVTFAQVSSLIKYLPVTSQFDFASIASRTHTLN